MRIVGPKQLLARRREDRFDALVENNRVTLLDDGRACFGAMLTAIHEARFEIFLEMYWFGSDATGRRFADALMEKARAGVTVFVIYDAVGSIDADGAMFDEMRTAGCEVLEYNPIAPWRRRFNLGTVNNRDHRKILVCDQWVGFTGGVNFGDPWAPIEDGGGGWRDAMIRVEGVAAVSMRQVFLFTWKELGGPKPGAQSMSEDELRDSGVMIPDRGSPVRVLANHYRYQRAAIRRSYLHEIHHAREHILITNSYFVPDRAVRRALYRARRRGVEVKVILPGESDVTLVYYAGRRLYDWLLTNGIELYEWRGTILHAKTASIDDRWCTVGTYNMDYRSWRSNLEVNVAVHDEAVASAMAARFRQDLERCAPITLSDWRYRPLGARVLEHLFYLFRRLL